MKHIKVSKIGVLLGNSIHVQNFVSLKFIDRVQAHRTCGYDNLCSITNRPVI